MKVLEERVAGAVELIARMRAENSSLAERAKKSENEVKRLQSEVEKLRASAAGRDEAEVELKALRAEKETVRTRIETILEKLSALDDSEE